MALQSGIEQVSRRKLGDSRLPLTKVGIFQEFKHLLLLQGTQLFHGQKSCVEKKQRCHEKVCSHCFFCKEVNQECGRQIKLLAEMLLEIAESKNILQADKNRNMFPNEQKRRTAALGPSSVRGNLLGDNGSYKKLRSCLGHLCCFQFFTFLC